MADGSDISGYKYPRLNLDASQDCLRPAIFAKLGKPSKTVDISALGCGHAAAAGVVDEMGCTVTGVDPSTAGIALAKIEPSHLDANLGSAFDDLALKYGQFSSAISSVAAAQLYLPRSFARTLLNALVPRGFASISMPYHGCWKNLAIAARSKFDANCTALWDYGQIKFWSIPALGMPSNRAGSKIVDIAHAWSAPAIAKSMVMTVCRPN